MAGFDPFSPGNPWVGYPTASPYQYPQPTGMMQPHKPGPVNNLLRVTGPESAKAYSVPPNSSVVLFDANEAIFYLKSTDDSGFATLRTFEFSEKAPDVLDVPGKLDAVDVSGFATKEDLESIEKKLADISESLKGLI